jgi:multiple sugar transport system permease protein
MNTARLGARRKWSVSSAPKWVFIVVFTVFSLFPVYWMINTSFKSGVDASSYEPTFLPLNPTMSSYTSSFSVTGRVSWVSPMNFVNSFIICLFTTIICMGIAAPAAYVFSKAKLKISNAALVAILVLRMIPPIVIVIPLYVLMRKLGLIDTYPALIISFVGLNLPLAIWLLIGFYDGIPTSLLDAGLLDGCSHFGVFGRIFLPLSSAGISTVAIIIVISSWNEVLMSLVMTRSAVKPISVAIAGMDAEFATLWGEIMALSVLTVLPVIVFAFIVQKNLIRGLTFGAVK